jgi:hypothetical protein
MVSPEWGALGRIGTDVAARGKIGRWELLTPALPASANPQAIRIKVNLK